ncbi:tRNA nucleotidyltransferase CCA-adding enzyme protein [Salinisphaera shabanensis E1L3A]|uniref:tRNA nucleotidyltransferase CCA-adding enzyme protein n=1 Tax=Salinisphaera shabanensis E1L3A TaxID=1033802 RepID=U2EQ85_9GAMM|nr:peptidoglycan DD-metalloendopeptidase family protein [Salinisphaera shabanensis]ERJ19945.1 tRNA nucleotidyltransferase CCA-adding enzyme protein [Salinisphaera shabanensis E1L3A]
MKRLGLVLLVAFVVAGCSIRGAYRPDTYTVRRGDTLSQIAASYGMDWRDLARWNNIRAPYTIEVGQRLSLDPYPPLDYSHSSAPPRNRPVAAPPAPRQPQVARAPQDSRAAQEAAIQASTPQLKRTIEHARPGRPSTPSAPTTPPPESVADEADVATEAEITQASRQTPTQPTRTGGPSEDGWQWPASGSIIRGYAAQRTRQGIDIGGREGSPVYAASSGRVVYNGTGLKGYGKLLIIKHDEKYLSAYGFTRNTRVSQGQDVAAGMHIADMGLGPQNKPMLHFEIRRDGRPIDPASLLPNAD